MKHKTMLGIAGLAAICLCIAILAGACGSTEEPQGNETPVVEQEEGGNTTVHGNTTVPGPIFMSLEGVTQGPIEGSCELPGHEGNITVYSVSQDLTIAFSTWTGDPSGRPQHNPVIITKPFDKSSPKLYNAFFTSERFHHVTLSFYQIDPSGTEQHYFTLKLSDAVITSIKPRAQTAPVEASGVTPNENSHIEEISFTYKKIAWTYEPEGIQHQRDWTVSSG